MTNDDVFYRISMILNVSPGEVRKIVEDYIKIITCEFEPLQPYPKSYIHIKPVKVKTLKERLNEAYYQKEEATMHEDCYFCIKRDICTRDVPKPCKYRYTEEERIADQASDRFGAILHNTYLHPTYRKKKEEQKMNATSTENFHDVIAIDFELQTFPNPDVNDKFIVSATNRDDIFCFVFEGPNIADTCRKAGLFTSWEKDQKIRELEAKLNAWKKEASDCLKMIDEVRRKKNEEINKLKEENEKLEKELESIRGYLITEAKRLRKKYDAENKLQEEPVNNVNHPSHYTGRYECIDVMQDVFGNEATDNFCLCNAFKYIWRARKKNGLEDVKKAVWYLNKYIEEAEDGEDKVTGT